MSMNCSNFDSHFAYAHKKSCCAFPCLTVIKICYYKRIRPFSKFKYAVCRTILLLMTAVVYTYAVGVFIKSLDSCASLGPVV